MVYLQDAENAHRLAELDERALRLLPALRSRLLKRIGAKISGHVGRIGGRYAAVYVAGGQLWLAIDDEAWPLDQIRAQTKQTDSGIKGIVCTPSDTYEFTAAVLPENDTTPFADPEDFAFGLWVARLIEREDRQEVLKQVLNDAPIAAVPHAEHASRSNRPTSLAMPAERHVSARRQHG